MVHTEDDDGNVVGLLEESLAHVGVAMVLGRRANIKEAKGFLRQRGGSTLASKLSRLSKLRNTATHEAAGKAVVVEILAFLRNCGEKEQVCGQQEMQNSCASDDDSLSLRIDRIKEGDEMEEQEVTKSGLESEATESVNGSFADAGHDGAEVDAQIAQLTTIIDANAHFVDDDPLCKLAGPVELWRQRRCGLLAQRSKTKSLEAFRATISKAITDAQLSPEESDMVQVMVDWHEKKEKGKGTGNKHLDKQVI